MFVALEGLDGAGKTLQASRLAAAMRARGRAVCLTREPSDGPVGALLRSFLVGAVTMRADAVALAFAADRLDHWDREIAPALAIGQLVICDRYVLSSLAYQSVDVAPEWVAVINRHARRPDLTIFLDAPIALCAQRLADRGRPTEQYETLERLRLTRQAYQRAIDAERLAGWPVIAVSAAGDPATVTERLLTAIDQVTARGRQRTGR